VPEAWPNRYEGFGTNFDELSLFPTSIGSSITNPRASCPICRMHLPSLAQYLGKLSAE
jgi:hypothetical protein